MEMTAARIMALPDRTRLKAGSLVGRQDDEIPPQPEAAEDSSLGDIQVTNAVEPVFRIMDLPSELWIQIGKLAINDLPTFKKGYGPGSLWAAIHPPSNPTSESTTSIAKSTKSRAPPAILLISSALREELLPYYYGTLQFDIYQNQFDDFEREILGEWLEGIGELGRGALRGVRLMMVNEVKWEEGDDAPFILRAVPEGEELARVCFGPQMRVLEGEVGVEVDGEGREYGFWKSVAFL